MIFLFVDTERVWRGGQEQLFTLMSGLHGRGHQVHLICPPGTPLEARARTEAISVHPATIRSEIGLISLFKVISILREVQPEIIGFNTPKAVLVGNLASRFASTKIRMVFRRVNFPLRKNILTKVKYRWGIDCIIAISEAIREQLQAGGVPGAKIRTIYEGIELSRFPHPARRPLPETAKPVTVGTVAHMSREKGMHILVDAASLIRDPKLNLRFVLVGDGDCLADLKQMAANLGMRDIIEFAGFQGNTADFLNKFDIFVLPSLSEGLSSAILEAMAASLPVVASRTGGIPEIVRDGDNGLLVPPGDAAALARAIEYLAQNKEEATRMGERGRRRIEEQFTMERKILETERLCSLLLESR